MKEIKLFKNRKTGFIGGNTLMHIIEIIFVITVSVSVFFILRVERDINTFPAESEILFNKVLLSNNGLWYYDKDIDRIYPGILEFENFNDKEKIEASLSKSIDYGKYSRAAFELVLEDTEDTKFESIYYNEQKYSEWIEWYKAGVTKGAGARQGATRKVNIIIKKEKGLTPGTLEINILIPNR